MENLDQAVAEIERLRKDGEKLQGELSGETLTNLSCKHQENVNVLFLFMRQEVTEIVSSSLNTQPSLVLTLCKTEYNSRFCFRCKHRG